MKIGKIKLMKMDDIIYQNYETYRKIVDALTDNLKLNNEIILLEGQTLDHILPVSFGFNWKLPPELISDKRNIQVIDRKSNSKKGYKCDGIPKFIQNFMINHHERCMKEKQMEGIRRAKERGVYTGRKVGAKESEEQFLNKPKIKEVVSLLNTGYKSCQIVREIDININTITKVKKILEKMMKNDENNKC